MSVFASFHHHRVFTALMLVGAVVLFVMTFVRIHAARARLGRYRAQH